LAFVRSSLILANYFTPLSKAICELWRIMSRSVEITDNTFFSIFSDAVLLYELASLDTITWTGTAQERLHGQAQHKKIKKSPAKLYAYSPNLISR